jgi:hypothetical protein
MNFQPMNRTSMPLVRMFRDEPTSELSIGTNAPAGSSRR